ncbi:pheophytinase, chloroplastic isoform X2 [Vigna angularis]|uniref:pheophytinase, chloroplastic isoform X2 n=1 Tax=Phaseolus angularis TaxID=3914 RepID=UPI00080A0AC2|nr:pheophytinase, chloroplastic isoform X2 [Vigna angularis]
MAVISAVHSVSSLHLQSHLQRLNNGEFFFSTRPRKMKVPLPCHHHHHPIYSSNAFGCSDRTSIIINSTSGSSTATSAVEGSLSEVEKIKQRFRTWHWKGQYSINYFVSSDSPQQLQANHPPLLLVHGFGASIPHWRRNIYILAQNYTVYAIDLLGFGASDKPPGFQYTMETWAQLILDFLNEVIQKPTVLIGNSVGSLACLIAASDSNQTLVRGIVLLNCAGGMNNKAIVDDWRIKLLLPLLWLIDFLLKQKGIASAIFERVKQRENLRNVLSSVYGNKESVDEELVEGTSQCSRGLRCICVHCDWSTGPQSGGVDAKHILACFTFVGRRRSLYSN